MRTAMKKALSLGMTAACSLSLASCGTTSNNDQGTSFQAFGWFQCPTEESCTVDELAGQSQGVTALFTDVPSPALGYWAYFGTKNNLSKQYIQVKRLDCSYSVPGTNLSVPDSSVVTGYTLSSSEGAADDVNGLGNVNYAGHEIIPTEVMQYLNVNQNSLPELPFTVIVNCASVGVTQSGDVIQTNDLSLEVRMVDLPEALDPSGFVQGNGTGGDYDSFSATDTPADAPAEAPAAELSAE